VSQTTATLARALLERGAPDEAQALIDASLPGSHDVDRAELLLAQGSIFSNRGDHLASLGATVEAGEVFQTQGLPLRLCDALVQTAGTLRGAGDHATALSTLEHAEQLAREGNDTLRQARVLRQIGIVSSILGRHQHALSCLEEAWAALRTLASPEELRHARLSLLNAQSRRFESLTGTGAGPPAAGIELHLADWQALAEEATAAGQTRLAVMCWGNHAIMLQRAGRAAEAAAELAGLLQRYRGFGMKPNEGLAQAELGRCFESMGDPATARWHYREARALLSDSGTQDDLIDALEGLARCEEQLGDIAAAYAALKELRAVEAQRRDDAARQALQQRELRIELARLTSQWARQATQDPLTGLANRRALERWIGEHWPRVEQGQPLAVVLLDLDHFKRINDTLGHDTGDLVLKEVAELLKAQCRGTDLAVRYGGEEFLLALAGNDLAAAAPLAERLRALIASRVWSALAPGLDVTASFGVADAGEALEPTALLTLADRRLYAAKLAGRDRVVAAG
jgi:diguanylate cyclase (GGDEF)-like protein